VYSNMVRLEAPPNAPASLQATPSTLPEGDTTRLSYAHNPVDTSAQEGQKFQHRLQGAGTWTTLTAVATSNQYLDLTPSAWGYADGQSFEWQVATKGADPTYSPFSATSVVALSAKPTVTISAPGATVTTSELTVAWAYYDAEGTPQSEWAASLYKAGVVIEFRSRPDSATATAFATPVEDGASYTVQVVVWDSTGLQSSTASQVFDVDYLPPADVTVAADYDDESGVMVLTLTADTPVGGVTLEPTSADIQRRIDGGAWLTIAPGLSPDAVTLDIPCTVDGLNEYRVIAYSALPSSVTSPIVEAPVAEPKWFFLMGGPSFSTVLKFYGNPTVSADTGRSKSLHHFERGDGSLPVQFDGNRLSDVTGMSATLESTSATVEDFKALSKLTGPVILKGPDIRRKGAMSNVSTGASSDIIATVSFSVTETAGNV